jgi:hypothetical protein
MSECNHDKYQEFQELGPSGDVHAYCMNCGEPKSIEFKGPRHQEEKIVTSVTRSADPNKAFHDITDNLCASGDCTKSALEHTVAEYASHGNLAMSQAKARRLFNK